MLSIDGPLCDALFAPRKGQPPPPETPARFFDLETLGGDPYLYPYP